MLSFDAGLGPRDLQHWSRRRVIASLLLVAASSACTHVETTRAPLVLFVCEFGTVKSAVSREVFRRRAAERKIAAEAFSRGLTVEDHSSPVLQRMLAADGIDPKSDPAAPLTAADWQRADILVWFNPLPPQVRHPDMRDWSDLPSFNDRYTIARPLLERRINMLLDELASPRRQN